MKYSCCMCLALHCISSNIYFEKIESIHTLWKMEAELEESFLLYSISSNTFLSHKETTLQVIKQCYKTTKSM